MSLARLEMCAERINKKHRNFSLLDVGCRNMALRPLLKSCDKYFGSDLIPGDGILECNLEKPLPFEDKSFDVVTVLDVLEHLDNPHLAIREVIRVAKKTVLVSLPNMYYITFRLNFLLGKGLSGKYAFSPTPVLDRHRWILSTREAVEFVNNNAGGYPVEQDAILPVRGTTKVIAGPVERCLAHLCPNLFSYGVLFEITKS